MGRLVTVTESETARIRETTLCRGRTHRGLKACPSQSTLVRFNLNKKKCEFFSQPSKDNMPHGLLIQTDTIAVAYSQCYVPDPSQFRNDQKRTKTKPMKEPTARRAVPPTSTSTFLAIQIFYVNDSRVRVLNLDSS